MSKTLLTTHELYEALSNMLIREQLHGQIQFELGDVKIRVKQRDVVGNIIQEWVRGWLDKYDIAYLLSDNTQMPPDFFLNPSDTTNDLLEIKAFNMKAGPGFDIADFTMYQNELIQMPYMLYADYLIFGYEMTDDGLVIIKNMWIKKVWEITRRMDKWALNLQIKKNIVHKIRPGIWYSNNSGNIPMFECAEDFLSAVEETVFQNPETHNQASTWRTRFEKSYEDFYGKGIDIPRWSDIKDKYKTSD